VPWWPVLIRPSHIGLVSVCFLTSEIDRRSSESAKIESVYRRKTIGHLIINPLLCRLLVGVDRTLFPDMGGVRRLIGMDRNALCHTSLSGCVGILSVGIKSMFMYFVFGISSG
jgi:hypothetical protein